MATGGHHSGAMRGYYAVDTTGNDLLNNSMPMQVNIAASEAPLRNNTGGVWQQANRADNQEGGGVPLGACFLNIIHRYPMLTCKVHAVHEHHMTHHEI